MPMLEQLTGDCCPKCNGSRTVIVGTRGSIMAEVSCDECAGTGVVNSPNACKKCRGCGNNVVLNIETRCDQCNGSGLEPKTAAV